MKTPSIDDKRLTQYALNEMSEDEKREFEKEISGNEKILQEIEEIREISLKLKKGFETISQLTLSDTRKNSIMETAKKEANHELDDNVVVKKHFQWKIFFSMAAMFVAGIIVFRILNDEVSILKDKTTDAITARAVKIKRHGRAISEQESVNIVSTTSADISEKLQKKRRGEKKIAEKESKSLSLKSYASGRAEPAKAIASLKRKNFITKKVDSAGTALKDNRIDVYKKKRKINYRKLKQPQEARIYAMRESRSLRREKAVTFGSNNTLLQGAPSGLASNGAVTFGSNNTLLQNSPPVHTWQYNDNFNTESYSRITENDFRRVTDSPLSTFSIDIDTASYANVRRFLNNGSLPPSDAIRIEEMINYFNYEYPQPSEGKPFSVNFEVASCPWNRKHKLVKIGIKGKEINTEKRLPLNLVFLIDVSGSMSDDNKLPLLKKAMKMLINKLTGKDRVAIVVYAGASGVVLPSTRASDKEKIIAALNNLEAGGSTNGGAGIKLAYGIAVTNYIENGINRVILATDGDFNVGITDEGSLERLITQSAKSGVFLTVLGFGMGNYKDSTLEKLADKGNGNYAYIDTEKEAGKVLVTDLNRTLITIAKDVKIQVEFNPALVEGYRLVGYENRKLNKEDFNDDRKDAGEIGAGHTVTALYEIVPKGTALSLPKVDSLKYQQYARHPRKNENIRMTRFPNELLTIKIRYKDPNGTKSKLLVFPVKDSTRSFNSASNDFKFAAAVAEFGMLLRNSKYKGDSTFESVVALANKGRGKDKYGYRKEFIKLAKKAEKLKVLNAEKPTAAKPQSQKQ